MVDTQLLVTVIAFTAALLVIGLLCIHVLKQQDRINELTVAATKACYCPQTNFDDVGDFHQKFGLESVTHAAAHPRTFSHELFTFRFGFLHEELEEFRTAVYERDDVKAFDALIDLVYVALGTAHLMGFPWQAGWDAVQRANMAKVRAQRATDSKRGSSFDVIKPLGWTPPDVAAVLRRHGWTDLAGPSESGV